MKASIEITGRVNDFVATVQDEVNKYFAKNYTCLTPPTFRIDEGSKSFKIVKVDNQNSVYCFVDKATGNILKAASWKAPAKHSRGNIFDANCGWGTAVNVYGANYIR